MPSSLTRGLPFTWGCSPRPPVSVCGTGAPGTHVAAFLGSSDSTPLAWCCHRTSRSRLTARSGGFASRIRLPASTSQLQRDAAPIPLLSPTLQTHLQRYRTNNRLSIAYAPFHRGLGLGPTNPTRTNLPSEPLGFRWQGFSPCLRYSYRHSHFASLQPSSRSTFFAGERSPTTWRSEDHQIRSVGTRLEPRYIVGAGALDQ